MNHTDSELLLAISEMLDKKLQSELQPIQNDIRDIKLIIEHTLSPQIRLLAENYVPAAQKYERAISRLESMEADIDVIKKVVTDHSEKIQKLA